MQANCMKKNEYNLLRYGYNNNGRGWMGGSFTRMAKPSDVLRRRHSKVCEVLDVSETTFRSLVGKLFSAGTIDMTTKATVLRKLGHEGADKLMDILEMKVEARPDRLQSILEIMVQEESLRDIFVDVVKETEDVTSGGSNHAHTPMIPNLVTNNPSVTIGICIHDQSDVKGF